MLKTSVIIISFIFAAIFPAYADDPTFKVSGDYINVHSGPASEFPIHYVLSRDDDFTITKQRANWYKVEAKRGIEGWISAESLHKASTPSGKAITVTQGTFDDYLNRDFELTVQGGITSSVTTVSLGASWVWTKNIALEATISQALGRFADNKIWSLRMRQTFLPNYHLSPYLAIGTGQIRTKPRANLVQSGDEVRVTNHYEVGIGMEYYLTEEVVVKAEYRSLLALTDRDEQERLDQWLLGISVFF